MAAANYDACLAKTLQWEGGYSNDAADPGGPTNYGITITDARKYWKPDATADDVAAMPLSVAKEIYRKHYWEAMNNDVDPFGVDLATFDYGVNSGVGRAIPCRNATKTDNIADWAKAICDKRLSFLEGLRTWSVFGRGWGRRVSDVKATAVKMALQVQSLPAPEVQKKLQTEAKAAKTKATVNGTAASGTAAGSGTTQVPQAPHHVDLSHLTAQEKFFAVIVTAALVVLFAYFVWKWWHAKNDAAAFTAAAKTT